MSPVTLFPIPISLPDIQSEEQHTSNKWGCVCWWEVKVPSPTWFSLAEDSMKAAFQDSASAFPSSQLITLTKEFTDMCKFDKSSSAPAPLPASSPPLPGSFVSSVNWIWASICVPHPMCKFCHILMRRDTKITKVVTFCWFPHADTACQFACDLTETLRGAFEHTAPYVGRSYFQPA